ncbi:predicted protein [Naegleria gruberi]|uniref:Predicted protein n=1 Tax=Naegleria gruberi TaxID=5762 RepID=D2VBJ5_NAEGR|nr:uncharacterized protein NAEGRDRAFT_66239 [Naegleria gruberi]EFC45917.1 predicted protein [Naegleria gruberi]|eukprot:XP_002678661.1 predicted protein [Naegleria gruberi strain NEG-M]
MKQVVGGGTQQRKLKPIVSRSSSNQQQVSSTTQQQQQQPLLKTKASLSAKNLIQAAAKETPSDLTASNDNDWQTRAYGAVELVDTASAFSSSTEHEIEEISPEDRVPYYDASLDIKVSNVEKAINGNKLASQVVQELGEIVDDNTDTLIDEEYELEKKKLVVLKDLQKKYPLFNSLKDQPLFLSYISEPTLPSQLPIQTTQEDGEEEEDETDEEKQTPKVQAPEPVVERTVMGNVTLAEILLELELEKVQKKRDEIVDGKSSIMTTAASDKVKFSSVPFSEQRKTYLDYRKERNELLEQMQTLPSISYKEPTHKLLEKKLDFSIEKKNSKTYMEGFVCNFYNYWREILRLQYYKVNTRWQKFADRSDIIERAQPMYQARTIRIQREFETASIREKDIQAQLGKSLSKNIIQPSDLQTIIRKQLYDIRSRRKVDQFLVKMNWLPYSERFNLFKKAFDLPGMQTDCRAPALSVVKTEIEDQLEMLKECVEMKKLPADETGQEFLYLVRNKFDAIFKAQSAKLKVLPYPYKDIDEKKAELASDTFTYLKESSWNRDEEFKSSQVFFPESSYLDQKQRILLTNDLRVDPQLQIECGFLHTTELQYARKRLKEQSDTHFKRARVEDEVQNYLNEGYVAERKTAESGEEEQSSNENKSLYNKISALYLLRFIRIREFKRKLLDLLNYFRSVEKRLYFDSTGYSIKQGGNSSTFIRKFFVAADDLEKATISDSLPLDVTYRDDKYSLHLKRDVVVRDANGLKVMYDSALSDYEELEERLLKIGSYFIERNQATHPKLQVDRFMVLESLLESETWYQDSKRKVIDCYMEAYEHCYEPKEQERLATAIMKVMRQTPKLNLESQYFSESYASEIICHELYHSLLKDIIKEQIKDERDYLSFIYEALEPTSERSGFPDNINTENYAQTELFPGSSKIAFLDFFPSIVTIGRIHEHLEKVVNNINGSFKFKNVLSLNAVKRAVLQQLIVEWKLISKEEKIQRALKNKLSDEIDDANLLEDPNELIYMLEGVIENERASKHNDDQENVVQRETEGGYHMSEKESTALQCFSNTIEMITLWKQLSKELHETEILSSVFISQSNMIGSTQQVTNPTLAPINFDNKDLFNESRMDTSEIRAQYLTNLAIVEFDSSMAEVNFTTFDGIKRLATSVGLFELRHVYQYQLLQKILYETAVKYNQTPMDEYFVNQEKKEFFLTSMNTNNDTSLFFTKEVLQELFLSFNNMKVPIRQRILKEYQKLSDSIIKSKRANTVRRYLRELKFRLSASFCSSMMAAIQPYILKCEVIEVVKEYRNLVSTIPEESGFSLGRPEHNVQVASHGVVSKNKDDHSNKCVLAKDGEVVNITYVPHYVQVMRTTFIQVNEEVDPSIENFSNLLQILQRIYLILRFWTVSIQATQRLYDVTLNEGNGLSKPLGDFCKALISELEHLRQPENPLSVIIYLSSKCDLLFHKYLLVLDNLKHKLRKENMNSYTIPEKYFLQLCNEKTEEAIIDSQFFTFSPCYMDEEIRIKYKGIDYQNAHILPLSCLKSFLLDFPDSERNYFSAEDANVSLCMEELLTEEKVYANSMPEQAIKIQVEFVKASVLMYRLRDIFLELSCENSKLMLMDEAKMEDLYNFTVFRKAKRIYEKQLKGLIATLEQKTTNDIFDVATQQKAKRKREKELRDKQVQILSQEISKLLISKHIQTMKENTSALKKELFAMEEKDFDDTTLDSKLDIFHNFLETLTTRGGKSTSKNGETIITIYEKELEKSLEEVGQKIRDWKNDYVQIVESKTSEIVDHLKRNLFSSEQKVKFLLYKRDVDRKSLKRRIDAEVDDKNYDLVFLVNNILWKNKELDHRLKEVKSEVRKELVGEYEDLVRSLYKELVSTNGKVAKFKKDFLQNLDQKFYEVRENTFFEIATQKDFGDASFKKKAIDVAMEDSELNKLRRENEDLKVQHTQLLALHKIRTVSLRSKYEKLIKDAELKRDEALKEFYASKYEVGLRENQLRQELLKTQQQLSNAEMEVEQLRKDLQLQIKNKQKLVNWKVKNAQLLEELEEKVEKYERWSHTNVDKLLLELEEKKREAGHYEKLKERMKEKTNAIDFKNQKTIETLKKKLVKEQSLKSKIMEQLETLKDYRDSTGQVDWQGKYHLLTEDFQQLTKENAILKNALERYASGQNEDVSSILMNAPLMLDGINGTPSPPSSGRKTASPSTLLRPITESESPQNGMNGIFMIEQTAAKKRPATSGAARAQAKANSNSSVTQQQLQQFKKASQAIGSISTTLSRPLTVLPTYGKDKYGAMPLQSRRSMSAGVRKQTLLNNVNSNVTSTANSASTSNNLVANSQPQSSLL